MADFKAKTVTLFDMLVLFDNPGKWIAKMDNGNDVTNFAVIYPERFKVTHIDIEDRLNGKIILIVEEIAE